MNQTVSFDQVIVTLDSTTEAVLMNAARYQVRLLKSRASQALDGQHIRNSVARFSLILAHVIDAKGFPFAVPDPYAHPETVGLAWDAYMQADPALWDRMLTAIDVSAAMTKIISSNLPKVTQEMDAVSAHNVSPFKRKPIEKTRR